MAIGQSDVPNDVDKLGMEKYADALASFIWNCETPMTIGIQGEWGSGKSTLIKLIQKELYVKELEAKKNQEGVGFAFQKFETWQYGVGGNDDFLGYYLISQIIEGLKNVDSEHKTSIGKIADSLTNDILPSFFGVAKTVAFLGASAAISTATGGTITGKDIHEQQPKSSQINNIVKSIDELKRGLQEIISQLTKKSRTNKQPPYKGVIVFVDDLDRIPPSKAVTMLEVMKNFMDIEGCVFVIACDYDVVREGVREKFNIVDERKARAFFEKIIQVPFQMPVQNYDESKLLDDYLRAKYDGRILRRQATSDVFNYKLLPMLGLATGKNPRTIKRFINSLELHFLLPSELGEKKNNQIKVSTTKDLADFYSLLALSAMQSRWPNVASYITSIASKIVTIREDAGLETEKIKVVGEIAGLVDVLTGLRDPSEIELLDEEIVACIKSDLEFEMSDVQWNKDPNLQCLCKFINYLWGILDVNPNDGTLTEDEVAPFIVRAKAMALTDVHYSDVNKKMSGGRWSDFLNDLHKLFKNKLDIYNEVKTGMLFVLESAYGYQNLVPNKASDSLYVDANGLGRVFSLTSVDKINVTVAEKKDSKLRKDFDEEKFKIMCNLNKLFIERTKEMGFVWNDAKVIQSAGLSDSLVDVKVAKMFFDLLVELLDDLENALGVAYLSQSKEIAVPINVSKVDVKSDDGV